MRVPLAVSIESRNGAVTKDAKVLNGLIEVKGENTLRMRKRPGVTDQGLVHSGTAQALTCWRNRPIAVVGDYLNIVGYVSNATHTTTWNPSDKDSDVVLTNGNLTATLTLQTGIVRSIVSVTSGLWYFEVTISAVGGFYVGMANASATLTSAPGFTNDSVAYYRDGTIYKNNTAVATGSSYTNADVIGIVYDADFGTIAFYKNNVLQYTATGANVPAGVLYAMCGSNGSGGAGTANFGATAFVYNAAGSASTALSPTSASLPFSMQDNGPNAPTPYLMAKNETQAWTVTAAGVVAQITDVDYPGQYTVTLTSLTRSGTTATAQAASDANFQVGSTVTIAGAAQSDYNGVKTVLSISPSVTTEYDPVEVASITRSGTTATVTTKTAHGLATSQSVVIEGADQAEYNGTFTITWISATSFSYTVPVTESAIVSPATGTLKTNINMTRRDVIASGAGTVTVTWVDHGFETGATVDLYGFVAPSTSFEFAAAITVVDANTFTMAGTIPAGALFVTATPMMGPAISSITGSGNTATVTFASAHHITRYNQLAFSGAVQPYYNIANALVTVTSPTTVTYEMPDATIATPATPATGTITSTRSPTASGFSFTFAVANSPVTPATGTITAAGGRSTVPGIAYIDGYFVVMDIYGVIYTSPEDDPTTWNPLDFTIAQAQPGSGVAITKSLQFVVAFKEWSTEFFYDAANDVGSPLSPVPNLFTLVGCASGWSVADVGGTILWIAQANKQTGRSVYRMAGSEQQKVSTPDIERILDADSLASVTAYGITLNGHPCYVLTLATTGITLVYDLASQAWSQWTSLTLGTPASITSITRSGTTCTVTFGAVHGLSDGDPLLIAGATQTDYNGIQQVSYVSTTVVTFETTATPATPATGTITGTPYTESYFKFTKYASCNGQDLVLHETDGHLYLVTSTVYRDAGLPVNHFARTRRLDGDTLARKKMARIAVAGDSVADTAMIRWSDDDSATFSAYQPVTLSDMEPNIRRCGAFKRRSIEYRHIGNTAPVIEALELEVFQ